jgi:hypothetical protein
MSEIKVNKISPATGTETTLGDTNDKFIVPSGAELEVASGATITNAGTATNFGGGQWTKIKSQEITSSTATMEWIDGTNDVVFDDTYTRYILSISKLKPANDSVYFQSQITTDGGSSWKTSNYYTTNHDLWYSTNYTSTSSPSVWLYANDWANDCLDGWGYIEFGNPTLVTQPGCSWCLSCGLNSQSTWGARQMGSGAYRTAVAYDGFKLYFSSGNIDTMKATLYGTIDGA